jgi:hypothetical protein
MPPPLAATRLASHWVVDALATDESLDFSLLKGKQVALQSASSVRLHSFVLSLSHLG